MGRRVMAVIPARLESTRFPEKVLHQYRGQALLFYVWQSLSRCKIVDRVLVATDSPRVAQVVAEFGGECFLSRRKHKTGSDRVAEVAAKLGGDIIVNVQADNFGLSSAVLQRAIKDFIADRHFDVGTLARRIDNDDDLFNPDVVKVITDRSGAALWFSRFPLPFVRDAQGAEFAAQYKFFEHIGVYIYRKSALARFAGWKQSLLEKAESLEQLRLLENRARIKVYPTRSRSVAVDSPRDLKKLDSLYPRKSN